MSWCYSGETTTCAIVAILSLPFATFNFVFSLYQFRPSSYSKTRGLYRTSRQTSIFLTFSFYGYILVTIGPNFYLNLFGTILIVLVNTLLVYNVGMYCFYHIQAVHSVHRIPSPDWLEPLFRWTGVMVVASTEISSVIVWIIPYQWPMIIPVAYGLIVLIIETIITWKYYLAITRYAEGASRSLQEKIEERDRGKGRKRGEKKSETTQDKFTKIRRTLHIGTGMVLGGIGVNGFLLVHYITNPYLKFQHNLTWNTLNLIMTMGPTLIIIGLGGLPGHENEKKSSNRSSGAKTYMDEEDSRSIPAPSSPPLPSSFPTTPPRNTSFQSITPEPPTLHLLPPEITTTPPLSSSNRTLSFSSPALSSSNSNELSTPTSTRRSHFGSIGEEEETLTGRGMIGREIELSRLGELTPRKEFDGITLPHSSSVPQSPDSSTSAHSFNLGTSTTVLMLLSSTSGGISGTTTTLATGGEEIDKSTTRQLLRDEEKDALYVV